jgi:biopolymer transport protein TolR
VVDLPSMGKARQRPPSVIEVIVGTDEQIKIRIDKADPESTTISALAHRVSELQAGRADVPVIIAGDKAVRYERVAKAMSEAREAGVRKIGFITEPDAK